MQSFPGEAAAAIDDDVQEEHQGLARLQQRQQQVRPGESTAS